MLRPANYRPPELKSANDLALMREAGKLVARALKICRDLAKPGTKTVEIDRAVEAFYAKHNATPLFKGYPGRVPFPSVKCLSVNEQVVHGIPGDRALKDGDMLKVDTACKLNGWCADRAITIPIGTVRPSWLRLLKVAEEVLQIAIDEIRQKPGELKTEKDIVNAGVRLGWTRGLQLIQRISANSRYFTDSATKIPLEVAQGDAACGMCIDFYGLSFEDLVRKDDGTTRVEPSDVMA